MPSKKPSAASSAARQPDPPTFFVDRSMGGRMVPAALRTAGAQVVAMDDLYEPDTPDVTWLTDCGRKGWVVLTRDQRLRYRPAEIAALRESGCLVFVVTAGQMTGPEMAEMLARRIEAISRIAATARRPAIYRITSTEIREMPDVSADE